MGESGTVPASPEKPEQNCEFQVEAFGRDASRRIKSYFKVFQVECKMIKVVERKDNLG